MGWVKTDKLLKLKRLMKLQMKLKRLMKLRVKTDKLLMRKMNIQKIILKLVVVKKLLKPKMEKIDPFKLATPTVGK